MPSAESKGATETDEHVVARVEPPTTEPVYDENGVDLSLIRWMLSLTPAQRLQALQGMTELVEASKKSLPDPKIS